MTDRLTDPLDANAATFMGGVAVSDVHSLNGPFAVVGAPFGSPYDIRNVHYDASEAPMAIRDRSARYGQMLDRYDFDLGGTPFDGDEHPVCDLGDVWADPHDLNGYSARVTETTRRVLNAGRHPIVLGGDDSTTWMALRAFQDQKPLTVVQFDAHIDFRDNVQGIRDGYSSPMRRASESSWVEKIVHVGARGLGSARTKDYHDTLDAGNAVVTARQIRDNGVSAVFDEIEPGSDVYIALDVDGLDPSVAPGTSAPLPGGLSFIDAQDIFLRLAREHRVAGMNVAEYYPSLDVNGITALAVIRLIASWLGIAVRTRGATT